MIFYCNKNTISIIFNMFISACLFALKIYLCLLVFGPLRRWTIHKHPPFEVTGPRSRPDGPQRSVLVAWLVASPIFCFFSGRKERETVEKCCFVCFWGELWAKMLDGILLEMKWMWLGGSDGVSVGGGHWRCCAKKNKVWSLEIGTPFLDVEGPQKSAWETPTCGYLWWWCLRTWEIQGIGMDWVDSRPG